MHAYAIMHAHVIFYVVILIYFGHGEIPKRPFQMPPSDDQDSGKLVFNPKAFERKQNPVDEHKQNPAAGNVPKIFMAKSIFSPPPDDNLDSFYPKSGKMLLICQSCYSGNIIEKWTKSLCVFVYVCSANFTKLHWYPLLTPL